MNFISILVNIFDIYNKVFSGFKINFVKKFIDFDNYKYLFFYIIWIECDKYSILWNWYLLCIFIRFKKKFLNVVDNIITGNYNMV